MRHSILRVVAFIAGTFLLGCQVDTTSSTTVNGENKTTLSISLEPSRTALGPKEGADYPVIWSEGDRIIMNGVASNEAGINPENPSNATFEVLGELIEPFHITYPYSANLVGKSPKVEFLAEQIYAAGSFAQNHAPMCGYVAQRGEKVVLEHLAGVLQFSVKAGSNGVVLDKIVITSTDGVKLSGEFDVNCEATSFSACENSSNIITYNLPDNFALSTTTESVFHITVPAIEIGNCTVEFIEDSGEKMTKTLANRAIKPGIVREFKAITYVPGADGEIEPMESYEDEFEIVYDSVFGYVKDINGNPIKGVAVSNGFDVVATNANGYYTLNVNNDCWYIYISLPAEYEVPINELGQPCFYKPYPSNTPQYDFTLTPLAGGKEQKFALFAIGDPQVRNSTQFNRFDTEAVPAIKKHSQEVKATGINCYGMTLGDIIANSDGTNTESLRDDMRDAFHADKAGLPVFQTYGNHDNTYYGDGVIISADKRSSTFELKAQRNYEEIFGPVDYSLNRGDVHIVSMRNIVYKHADKSGKYAEGFLKHQYEWLKKDLALVPKDKLVILCVHAPIFRNTGNYVEEVEDLLCEFDEAHIVSGHTHYSRNFEYSVEEANGRHTKLYDHNVGALCGVWWRGNIACDGAPTGYNVFVCDGNKFVESYFMGVNEGMNTKEKQMRLHRGNALTGRAKKDSDTYEYTGHYAFNFGEDYLIANIYNADSKWTIKVFENGKHTGNMEKVAYNLPAVSTLIGSYTEADPRRAAAGVDICVDMYTAGLYYNYYSGRSAWSECYHLYKYKLNNKDADIRVEATDGYGNVFTETEITEGTDYSLVAR